MVLHSANQRQNNAHGSRFSVQTLDMHFSTAGEISVVQGKHVHGSCKECASNIFKASYHRQCDGMVERMNRTVLRNIRAFLSDFVESKLFAIWPIRKELLFAFVAHINELASTIYLIEYGPINQMFLTGMKIYYISVF